MSGAAAAATANGVIPQFVDIVDVNLHDFKVAPTTRSCYVYLNSDGTRNSATGCLSVPTPITRYELQLLAVRLTGGDTTATWLSLGTSRMWYVQASNTVNSATMTVEIRRASDGVVLDTATVTLDAESTP
jgi:hypothetical protein